MEWMLGDPTPATNPTITPSPLPKDPPDIAGWVLQRSIGSAVFSASSDTQMALEGYQGHGLFTWFLLEGLQGQADDLKDGFITVRGLADYVEEQVLTVSEKVFKRQQTPIIQTSANFPIGKVPAR